MPDKSTWLLAQVGMEGLHGPSFGPRPLASLSGITRCGKDAPYQLWHPHPMTPQPCSLHRGGPQSLPHPQSCQHPRF